MRFFAREIAAMLDGKKPEPPKPTATVFGFPVAVNPALPPDRIEFRDPETGCLLIGFSVQSK